MPALVLVTVAAAVVSPDDASVVGALDVQYQAAVKAHDVATMDRIALVQRYLRAHGGRLEVRVRAGVLAAS
jgi:hypothetical protein